MHSSVEFELMVRVSDESSPFSDTLLRIVFLDKFFSHGSDFSDFIGYITFPIPSQ
jgi:hypothetical protein